jgi:hypothetical protein
MTTWDSTNGAGGTLRITDTGDDVEFWFKAKWDSDHWNNLGFSYTANGSTHNTTIDYPTGADWHKVGSVSVSTSQTVTFKLTTETGVSGIGGPSTFSHAIDRDSAPGAPSTPVISGVKATSVVVTFKDGATNGDAIDSRQIRYDNNSDASSSTTVSSDGSTTITGLSQATTYYFWARTHNSQGWGPWSGRASAKTVAAPAAPSAPLISSVTATTADVNWSDNSDNGNKITGHQISYGITPWPDSNTIISASAPRLLTGLSPGLVYWIAVRAQNASGWSDWSRPTKVMTIAGIRVNVNGVWKLAVPYVKVGGVWKVAEAWTKSAGTWVRTI